MSLTRDKLLLLAAGLLIGAGLGLALLLGLGLGGPALARLLPGKGKDLQVLFPKIDKPAADFELKTLDGETIRLADLRGHPVVINFWATWCGPCRLEMPLLQSYAHKYAPSLVVLGVNYDEPAADVQAFVQELGLDFKILMDPGGKVTEDIYRVRGFPTTFFVDKDGVIRYQHIGQMDEGQLVKYLEGIGVGQ